MMNYLAHLFLSGDDREIRIGNFIGDVIKSSDFKALPKKIHDGVKLHRKIDSFTDRHPVFISGVKRLRKTHGKYAPVLLDILYDHLLALHFHRYANTSLGSFSAKVYNELETVVIPLPFKAKRLIHSLTSYKYLEEYQSQDGLRRVLARMDKRAKFPSKFVNGIDDLIIHHESFNEEFHIFFPELIQFTNEMLFQFNIDQTGIKQDYPSK